MDQPDCSHPDHEEDRLVEIDQAKSALERASSIPEVQLLRDKAESIRIFLRQQQSTLEAQNRAAELKLYAERRLGELLKARVRRGGSPKSQRETSLPEGINRSQSHRWQRIASIPREAFEEHVRSKKARGDEITSNDAQRLARSIALREEVAALETDEVVTESAQNLESLVATHSGSFRTIYADPPWAYDNGGSRGAANNHYPTLSIDEIKRLPISDLAHARSHLHLWTTNAFLFAAREIIEAWGFEYKSCFVWVKPQMGTGNYWRVSHEFLLLGVRGKLPFLERDCMSWVEAPRTVRISAIVNGHFAPS
ncbi:MAG: MT-A70 family methyltransferase [bacterium]|nr:MT-A70 family methyltransferase [bacterium]